MKECDSLSLRRATDESLPDPPRARVRPSEDSSCYSEREGKFLICQTPYMSAKTPYTGLRRNSLMLDRLAEMQGIALIRVMSIVAFVLGAGSSLTAAERVDYDRDVRQILSDKCFRCHGPDDEARQADLRLDSPSAVRQSGILASSSLDDSQFWQRITSEDPDVVMPPPASEKSLTSDEKSVLGKWISQGAEYDEHWAFVSPSRPAVPKLNPHHLDTERSSKEQNRASEWPRNPIDAFVYQRMQAHGLEPSPVAEPSTLVRRLYLDLIGLPPRATQVEHFVENPTEEVYAQLVEQLLESKHFGERWARWWLDAARYSDSDGYEKDKPRSVWFYRDWVIGAMNNNMPYDQFIIEQLAGDLLPGASQSQRVATGFLRNSMVNEEGGADPEQFRVEAMFDRMDAVGKAILGITTQCAVPYAQIRST